MKFLNQYESKKKLFEIFQKVNGVVLKEEILPKDKKEEIIGDFVDFVIKKINIDDVPQIKLSYDNKEASRMKSFGGFSVDTNELFIVMANRNLADILRTIAHELIHYKQNKQGILKPNSGETGSDVENQANALAGIIMREYGRKNPIIFE